MRAIVGPHHYIFYDPAEWFSRLLQDYVGNGADGKSSIGSRRAEVRTGCEGQTSVHKRRRGLPRYHYEEREGMGLSGTVRDRRQPDQPRAETGVAAVRHHQSER